MNLPEYAKDNIERIENAEEINIGDWFWTVWNEDDTLYGENALEPNFETCMLACVTKIGSNFIKLQSPSGHYERVHVDEFFNKCKRIENPERLLEERVNYYREQLRLKMEEIRQLTNNLGVTPDERLLPEKQTENALVPLHGTDNLNQYKNDLIKAKEETLPDAFKEMNKITEKMSKWMSADILALNAIKDGMENSISLIQDRVFNVELYAGLTEQVVHIREGSTAKQEEKIHLMQRRFYMDEECLVKYESGGMEFGNIGEFDEWLARDENFNRILPFQRCVVSFRVRRSEKEHEIDNWSDELSDFISFMIDDCNERTFMYIRNGENLYRMNCDLNFGEKLFPSNSDFNPNEKMWARMFANSIHEVLPEREYQDIMDEHHRQVKLSKEWYKENPDESWVSNPYNTSLFYDYEPFDKGSVYYDDIKKFIDNQVSQYNRIVLILQGLLDRSDVFAPHEKVKLWKHDDFQEIIELVYDADKTLYAGEKPDFEAYRKRLNKTIKQGSMTVGQQTYWERKEAEKENQRQENDWRIRKASRYSHYHPYGNPGPGVVAKVVRHTKTKKSTFEWERERIKDTWKGDTITTKITIPDQFLLNIDEYKAGDFKQFYEDPRTRMEYLKWAPLLLVAEDYVNGKYTPKEEGF